MNSELAPCRVTIVGNLGGAKIASQWTATDGGLEIALAATGRRDHDIALELLLCLGQALWERLSPARSASYWMQLDQEIGNGVSGEIDKDALHRKRRLLSGRESARSPMHLKQYGAASFAGTAAEYVHALWHDVTVRAGAAFLPAEQLRRRLELLSCWYPPGRGHRLFPPPEAGSGKGGESPLRHGRSGDGPGASPARRQVLEAAPARKGRSGEPGRRTPLTPMCLRE